jgi:hypothetical protein
MKNYWKVYELNDDVEYWGPDLSKDISSNKLYGIRTFLTDYLNSIRKQAFNLYNLIENIKLQIPNIVYDENIFMFVKQGERYNRRRQSLQFALENEIVRNEEIQTNPEKYVFGRSSYSLRELTEIRPSLASIYILGTSKLFSEKREMLYEKLINWLEYYGILMYHTHASDRICPLQLQETMERIKPQKIFTVYTPYTNLFSKFISKFIKEVVLSRKGNGYKVTL